MAAQAHQNVTLTQQMDEVTKELQAAQKATADKATACHALDDAVAAAEREQEEMRGQLAAMQKSLVEQKDMLDAKQSEANGLQQHIAEMEAAMQAMKEMHLTAVAEQQRCTQEREAGQQQELAALKAQHQSESRGSLC